MTHKVIGEFINRIDGERVLKGSPLPKNLDKAELNRLIRAKCIAWEEDGGNFRGGESKPADKKAAGKKPADKKATGGSPAVGE